MIRKIVKSYINNVQIVSTSFKWDRAKSYILLKNISFGRHRYKKFHRAIKNQGEKKNCLPATSIIKPDTHYLTNLL